MPLPSSDDRNLDVDVAHRTAATRITDDSDEYLAALDSRLPRTCTMRRLSAITRWQVRADVDVEIMPAAPV